MRDTVINVHVIIVLISVTVSAEDYYGSYKMALYTEWLVMQSSVYHLLLMQGVYKCGWLNSDLQCVPVCVCMFVGSCLYYSNQNLYRQLILLEGAGVDHQVGH